MAKYCADCAYMDTCERKDGRFACNNSRKSGYQVVSARKLAGNCNGFTEAWQSRRGERERERYMKISREHGYYIATAITSVLGLPEDNEYVSSFAYLRDVYMPDIEEYQDFIVEYESVGPRIAASIMNDENNKEYAEYLLLCYLEPFSVLVSEDLVDEAIELYKAMFEEVKNKYVPSEPDKDIQRLNKVL